MYPLLLRKRRNLTRPTTERNTPAPLLRAFYTRFLIGFALVVGLFGPATAAFASNPFAATTLGPSSQSCAVGTSCTVRIVFAVPAGGYTAYGIDALVGFDATKLQVTSLTTGGSSPFTTVVKSTFNNASGSLEYAATGSPVSGATFTVASIVFSPIAAGSAAVTFKNVNEDIVGYGPYGVNGLAVGGSITVTGNYLTATTVNPSEVDLSWDLSPTGTPYVILYRCAGVGCNPQYGTYIGYFGASGAYTDTNVSPGITYHYFANGNRGYLFAYGGAPVITGVTYTTLGSVASVSPNSGPTAGGTAVTLAGYALGHAGPVSVSFGGTAGTNASSVAVSYYASSGNDHSPYQIKVNSPAHAAAKVDVTVTTNGGTSATSAQDSYTFTPPPDAVPPVTGASLSPVPNASGWNNTNVTVSLNATDNETNGTGVQKITYSAAGAQTIAGTTVSGSSASLTINAEGSTTLTYFATDNAGNVEAAHTLVVKIDKTAPTITGTASPGPNSYGWNNTSVTISFSCGDNLSGVASCSLPTTLANDGAGQSVTGYAADVAGNTNSITVDNINIDTTPPIITYSGNVGSYTVDQTVSITCTAGDNLSGVASTTCQNIDGPAYTYALGTNSFSASAIDKAGNTGTGSTSFVVQVTYASLCNLTHQFSTKDGIANSLCVKLNAAAASAARGDNTAKAGQLAAYVHELSAQSGKAFTPAQVAVLTRLAQAL